MKTDDLKRVLSVLEEASAEIRGEDMDKEWSEIDYRLADCITDIEEVLDNNEPA